MMSEVGIAQLAALQQNMTERQKMLFAAQYASMQKDRNTALVLSLMLGWLGADRFYVGDTGLGIGKLLTGGGLGLWVLIDWFLIMGRVDKYNWEKAQEIAFFVAPHLGRAGAASAPPPLLSKAQVPSIQGSGTLLVTQEGREVFRRQITQGAVFVIGRAAASDIVVNDQRASGSHARLEFLGDGSPVLRDLSSTNGTFVGAQRVNGAVRIQSGTTARFGDTQLAFSW